jgi:hypothetical protein
MQADIPSEWAHKGILGPIMRAEVGDTLVVTFKNMASKPCTISPSGLRVEVWARACALPL